MFGREGEKDLKKSHIQWGWDEKKGRIVRPWYSFWLALLVLNEERLWHEDFRRLGQPCVGLGVPLDLASAVLPSQLSGGALCRLAKLLD